MHQEPKHSEDPQNPELEITLIGVRHEADANDRLVAVDRHSDHVDIPLDRERRRNVPLLNAGTIFLRADAPTPGSQEPGSQEHRVLDRRHLDDADRRRLEGFCSAPLGTTTDVISAYPTAAAKRPAAVADFENAIVVPLTNAEDADRIFAITRDVANRTQRPVELLRIIGRDYDLGAEVETYAQLAAEMDAATTTPTRLRLLVSDDPAQSFFDTCVGQFVCMTTTADPYRRGHFVDSYAAGLLARTTAPVLLVGPKVEAARSARFNEVVVALSGEPDSLEIFTPASELALAFGLPVTVVHVACPVRTEAGTSAPGEAAGGFVDENLVVGADGRARMWFPGELHGSLSVEPLFGTDIGELLAARASNAILGVATHGRCGLDRIADGSVLFDALTHAQSPVLAVGPHVGEALDEGVSTPVDPERSVTTYGSDVALLEVLRSRHDAGQVTDEVVFTPDVAPLPVATEYVVVLDGSARAAQALGPAMDLARGHGAQLSTLVVSDAKAHASTLAAVGAQLSDHGLARSASTVTDRVDLERLFRTSENANKVVVTAAFGSWDREGRTFGLLTSLVTHDAPIVYAIGPEVPDGPIPPGPLVLCVDNERTTDQLVARLDRFVGDMTTDVIVLHVTPPAAAGTAPPSPPIEELAMRISHRWGVPAAAHSISGSSAAASIAAFARTKQASLILMVSHHRGDGGRPSLASVSLATVAHAACPVAIVAAKPDLHGEANQAKTKPVTGSSDDRANEGASA